MGENCAPSIEDHTASFSRLTTIAGQMLSLSSIQLPCALHTVRPRLDDVDLRSDSSSRFFASVYCTTFLGMRYLDPTDHRRRVAEEYCCVCTGIDGCYKVYIYSGAFMAT